MIAATNGWTVAFDNLSGLPPWLSDSLCTLATGGGFSTRELYTDGDEKLFEATRPIIINGIDFAPNPCLASAGQGARTGNASRQNGKEQ